MKRPNWKPHPPRFRIPLHLCQQNEAEAVSIRPCRYRRLGGQLISWNVHVISEDFGLFEDWKGRDGEKDGLRKLSLRDAGTALI